MMRSPDLTGLTAACRISEGGRGDPGEKGEGRPFPVGLGPGKPARAGGRAGGEQQQGADGPHQGTEDVGLVGAVSALLLSPLHDRQLLPTPG